MGIFSRDIATLNIFFDTDSIKDTKVTCVFEGDKTPEELLKFFILYTKRIKWNVGNSNVLFNVIEYAYIKRMSSTTNITKDIGLEFVELTENNCVSSCSAKFKSNGGVITTFKSSTPESISVTSVAVFAQYILNLLSESEKVQFIIALQMYYSQNK